MNPIDCFGSPGATSDKTACETLIDSNPCDFIDGGTFFLSDASKLYFPHICNENGDLISYVNSAKENKRLFINKITHIMSKTMSNTFMTCPMDSTETIYICSDIESVFVSLESEDKSLELVIRISANSSLLSSTISIAKPQISIYKKSQGSFDFRYDLEGELGGTNDDREHYESIDLNGSIFNDVISMDITKSTDPNIFKYYYSKTLGLIGFLDSDGILWVINN